LQLIFETRFGATFGGSANYSIRGMGLEAYVRDWRFHAHGAAVSVDGEPDHWVTHADLPRFFGQFDWSRCIFLAHNAQFDGLILSHHYGHVAGMYCCTMQMARMLALPGSLAGLADHFGLPPKGKDLALSRGLHTLPAHVEPRIAKYSEHDNFLCREIFKREREMLPRAELEVVSNVTKMFVRPLMRINPEPLRERIAQIDAKHELLMNDARLARGQLMSNPQLGAFFASEGLDWTDRSMAKTNPEFLELLEHPNENIALAVAARLGIKGTMERSRCETFLSMGERGGACVYLNCGGAGTTRFCLTGDTLIVVQRDFQVQNIELRHLRNDDLVWDGQEFVTHRGLVSHGIKKVMTYDGITGTPDHRVFIADGCVSLERAAQAGTPILDCPAPSSCELDVAGGSRFAAGEVSVQVRHGKAGAMGRVEGRADACVQGMRVSGAHAESHARRSEVDRAPAQGCGCSGVDEQVQVHAGAEGAGEHHGGRSATLSEQEKPQVLRLRRPRAGVRVCDECRGGEVCVGDLGAAPEQAALAGSDRQQCGVCGGQSSVGRRLDAEFEQAEVFDIEECGPRNCFSANGKLVHNSGGESSNYQNLKRGSPVRTCHEAPEGHELIISDSAQIEARILDTLAGQEDSVAAWRAKVDQYSNLAMAIHPGVQIAKGHPLRNDGKVLKLAMGYSMSAATLQRQLAVGLMGNPPLQVTLQEAERRKNVYRDKHPMVVRLWYRANDWITAMAEGKSIDFKMLRIREGRIELPNGLILRYPHLHQTPDGWTYRSQHGSYYKLYGASLIQNVCEALARDVVITQSCYIARELPWVSSTHDEGVFVAPSERAEELTSWVEDAMRTVLPEWAKGWPIDAEASHSVSYDK
jgi:hypothetical protein